VIAIVVACVVVGLGVPGFLVRMSTGNGADTSLPRYKVSLPKTLVDGKYKLAKDMTAEAEAKNPDLGPDDNEYTAIYSGSSAKEQIVYTGLNSDATGGDSVTESDDKALDNMEESPSVDVAVPRREITPSGADEPLTCEVMTKAEGGQKLSVPACAWGDRGSVGLVAENSYDTLLTTPKAVDLEAFADQVNTVRDEVRSPAE
jgi:hypothetical protein